MKRSYIYRFIVGIVLFLAATVFSGCGKTYQSGGLIVDPPISNPTSAFSGLMGGSVNGIQGYTISCSELNGSVLGLWSISGGGTAITGSLIGTTNGLTMTVTGLTQTGCTATNVTGTLTADKLSSGAKITGNISATLSGGALCTSLVNAPVILVKQ